MTFSFSLFFFDHSNAAEYHLNIEAQKYQESFSIKCFLKSKPIFSCENKALQIGQYISIWNAYTVMHLYKALVQINSLNETFYEFTFSFSIF